MGGVYVEAVRSMVPDDHDDLPHLAQPRRSTELSAICRTGEIQTSSLPTSMWKRAVAWLVKYIASLHNNSGYICASLDPLDAASSPSRR